MAAAGRGRYATTKKKKTQSILIRTQTITNGRLLLFLLILVAPTSPKKNIQISCEGRENGAHGNNRQQPTRLRPIAKREYERKEIGYMERSRFLVICLTPFSKPSDIRQAFYLYRNNSNAKIPTQHTHTHTDSRVHRQTRRLRRNHPLRIS